MVDGESLDAELSANHVTRTTATRKGSNSTNPNVSVVGCSTSTKPSKAHVSPFDAGIFDFFPQLWLYSPSGPTMTSPSL